MDIKKFLISAKEYALWMLFTNHCLYCNKVIEKNEDLCEECKENSFLISGEKCKLCGVGKDRCTCKKHRNSYDGISSPFYYENGAEKGLKLLKFNNKPVLARNFSRKMAESVRTDFPDVSFDYICFVPFSPLQKIKRSYNQSELLAQGLSRELGVPLKPLLIKLYESDAQHKTGAVGRRGNVFGIYDVSENVDVTGKTILLVDDIKTSGSTLENGALILKIRGAKAVYCTTAAIRAQKSKSRDKP